jgi:hypothetical protein
LCTLRLTESDFRWLICAGYLQQAREVTQPEDPSRRFLPVENLAFSPQTCFVLSETGVRFTRSMLSGHVLPHAMACPTTNHTRRPDSEKPVWDGQLRELRVRVTAQ